MTENTINGVRRMIVKAAIREFAEDRDDHVRPGTGAYDDLMANVEGQVQTVLEDMGEIEY